MNIRINEKKYKGFSPESIDILESIQNVTNEVSKKCADCVSKGSKDQVTNYHMCLFGGQTSPNTKACYRFNEDPIK